ncbi:MAG: PucR family transcriptional regulator [Actinomycetota bacterium]
MTIELRIGHRPVQDILLRDRTLVDRIIAAVAATNPAGHRDGNAVKTADLRWAVELSLRAAAASMTGDPRRDDGEHDELLRASAVRRFEEGSSFASVVLAYHRGIAVIWSELRALAAPDESATVAECAQRLFELLERITVALSEDIEHTWSISHAGERDARFSLFAALTQGGDAVGEAHRSGRVLAPHYGVLVVRLAAGSGDAPGDVLARRATQRLRSVIDSLASAEVFAVLGGAGGTALVPLLDGEDTAGALREALRAEFGDHLVAGWVQSPVDGIPEAVGIAEELVDLAHAVDAPRGLNTLEDMLLEYQSARPGLGRAMLARRLDGVSDDLLATVDTYLAAGGDRRATARLLQVHPNTVDYRLGRVSDLCGMDATTPNGAAQLRASRVAGRLCTPFRAPAGG